jgi:excisionase family DNA binding protein
VAPGSADQHVSIREAARALGVSKRTVLRYLDKRLLTRVKEGKRTYIPMRQISQLRDIKKPDVTTSDKPMSDNQEAAVTIDRGHYETLLTRLGHLENECQSLLQCKERLADTEARLRSVEEE